MKGTTLVKPDKILRKVLSGSKNVRFNEFVTLIEGYGFVLDRIRGSHQMFSHPDIPDRLIIQPRRHGQAKPYQVRQLLKMVEQYDLKLDEDKS